MKGRVIDSSLSGMRWFITRNGGKDVGSQGLNLNDLIASNRQRFAAAERKSSWIKSNDCLMLVEEGRAQNRIVVVKINYVKPASFVRLHELEINRHGAMDCAARASDS